MSGYAMYLILNSSLKMTPGKAIAQAGHVIEDIVEKTLTTEGYHKHYIAWKTQLRRKITLKATQEQMEYMEKEFCSGDFPRAVAVRDAGLTQIPVNSLTCIGFFVTDNPPEFLKTLKLY